MDVLARELRMDPADVRRKNFIKADKFPFTTQMGAVYDSGETGQSPAEPLTGSRHLEMAPTVRTFTVSCQRPGDGRSDRSTMSPVITRGIREFVSRDWAAARDSKDRYWGERIDRLGPLEGLRVADELRRQVLGQDAGWPDAALRREDLQSHVRLVQLLRLVDTARRP